VPLLAFLAGVMRNLCDEQWRHHRRQDYLPTPHDIGGADDPERACAAAEALAAIQRLFASDAAALKVITGLISGMVAEDIRRHYDLTAVEYDTTRRRIRRTMLHHGLAWSWP
jgi:RNA polymerase sigma-70 factor (ECF subfamily)